MVFLWGLAALAFVFWIWMLVHAITNKGLTDVEKIVWVLVVLFLHFMSAPRKCKNKTTSTQTIFSTSVSPLFVIACTSIQIQNTNASAASPHRNTIKISPKPATTIQI